MKIAPDWLSEEGMHTLSNGYLLPGETPRKMFDRVSAAAASFNRDSTLTEDLFHCLWNGWIGLSSPVAANFGASRALPVACYSNHLSDSIPSIYSHKKELAMLSKNGGGTASYFGDIRPAGAPISGGGKSDGVVPWAREYDQTATNVSQGGVRRGQIAIYLPIDHPDLLELLRAKDHTKGDPRMWIDANIAVTITDAWLESMVQEGGEKQELFGKVLATRLKTGSPYLIFIDNVNRQNPECYTQRGLEVKTSNLCSEIFLHTDENHTFVCVLSSINLSRYDEFKDWKSPISGRTVPQIATHLLEAVVSEFIKKAKGMVGMGRAVRFAEKSRALGLGSMGLHLLYQKRGLPFKSVEARSLNIETHKWIREEAEIASRELAAKFGEPEWCVGSGMRHTHLTAIAPTRTNSVISGAFSQGIEPCDRNYFVAKQAKGTYVRKNPVLEEILCERGVSDDVWDEILKQGGSVQHLTVLTNEEKEIFLTAREIDQFEIIRQASERQPYVDQGQSLNTWVDPEAEASYLFRLHLAAWKANLKSLYYMFSSSLLTKKDVITALIVTKDGCPYCIKLKEALTERGVQYEEISKEGAIAKGYWNNEWKTVPQLWLWGRHIGGYSEYLDYLQSGESLGNNQSSIKECAACEA